MIDINGTNINKNNVSGKQKFKQMKEKNITQ